MDDWSVQRAAKRRSLCAFLRTRTPNCGICRPTRYTKPEMENLGEDLEAQDEGDDA